VPVVLEPVAFGAPGRKGQNGIEPIQRLNRGLLVDAEDGGMLRGIEVQPDHIRGFRLEFGIRRPHVPLEPMRLQAGMLPGPRHNGVLHAQLPPERPRGPVGRAVRRRPTSPRHNARFQGRRQHRGLRAAMTGGQSRQAVLREAVLPQRDRPRTAAGHGPDHRVAVAVGQQQNHPRPTRRIRPAASRSHACVELGPLVGKQRQWCSRWHAPSYDLQVVSTSH
jgi:hypothetical protein